MIEAISCCECGCANPRSAVRCAWCASVLDDTTAFVLPPPTKEWMRVGAIDRLDFGPRGNILVTWVLCALAMACPVVIAVLLVKQDHADAAEYAAASGPVAHIAEVPAYLPYAMIPVLICPVMIWLVFRWVTRIRPEDGYQSL